MSDLRENERSSGLDDIVIPELIKEAEHLISQDEFEEAVNLIQENLAQLIEKYGELGLENAPVFFLYGKALYQSAKHKALFNVLPDDVDQSAVSSSSSSSRTAENNLLVDISTTKVLSVDRFVKHKQEANPEAAAATEADADGKGTVDSDNEEEGDDKKTGDDDEEEEEEEFQLAWEWLETVRVIYEKDGEEKNWEMMAEVLTLIGQLGLEVGNGQQSVKDLTRALEIIEAHSPSPSEDRAIYEARVRLGISLRYNDLYDEAAAQFKLASDILVARFEAKQKNPSSVPELLSSLKEAITDIRQKLEEVIALANQNIPDPSDPVETPSDSSSSSSSSSSAAAPEAQAPSNVKESEPEYTDSFAKPSKPNLVAHDFGVVGRRSGSSSASSSSAPAPAPASAPAAAHNFGSVGKAATKRPLEESTTEAEPPSKRQKTDAEDENL